MLRPARDAGCSLSPHPPERNGAICMNGFDFEVAVRRLHLAATSVRARGEEEVPALRAALYRNLRTVESYDKVDRTLLETRARLVWRCREILSYGPAQVDELALGPEAQAAVGELYELAEAIITFIERSAHLTR